MWRYAAARGGGAAWGATACRYRKEKLFNPALRHARAAGLPPLGRQQIGVMSQEGLAHARIAQQEAAELLGKDIIGAHRVPRFAGKLGFFVGRRRNGAEVHLRHALDFVVVVEHDPAQAGDAEVLVQHVAREDIGRGELADGVAVLAHGDLEQRVAGVAQVEVQRHHAPLDVDVADHHRIAVFLDQAGDQPAQFFQQPGAKRLRGSAT